MNTLGASLTSVRSATETPAGRTARDDDGQAAFGSVLGALSDERPPEARETSTEAEASAPPTLPQGDAAPALAMLAALDAAVPKSPPIDTGVKTGADTIGTLIARALPANGGAPALGTGGRLQVAVIAQETHFAPVKPHPVSLTGAVPAASPAETPLSSILPGLSEPSVIAPPTDAEADSGVVQAAALAASSSPQMSRAAQAPSLFAAASASGPVASGVASGSAGTVQPIGAASPGDMSPSKPLAGTDPLSLVSPSDASVLSAASASAPSASVPRKPASTDAARTAATGTAKPDHGVITTDSASAFSETETAEANHAAPRAGEAQAGTLQESRLEIGQSGAAGTPGMPGPAAGEPSRQVAAAVLAQVGSVPTAAEASLKAGMDGPLRILTIQLRPDDLGTVLVRMRLRGDQLEMSLHASREETAALLRSDTGALDGLLRSAGYQPDIITIGAGRVDAPASGEPARAGAGAGFDGPGRDAGGSMADQSGRREPDPRDSERRNIQRDAHSDETTPGGPGRIGRYL